MKTYPIPECFVKTCQDDDWAIAAILLDRAVALLYLSEIAPELGAHVDAPSSEFMIKQWARKATPDFLELQALGEVSVGVITANGFEARWKLAEWVPNDQLPEGA